MDRKQRNHLLKQNLIAFIFILFVGFISGNLFGTFLNYVRQIIPWDGAIVSILVLGIEAINYLNFVILNNEEKQQRLFRRLFEIQPTQSKIVINLLEFLLLPFEVIYQYFDPYFLLSLLSWQLPFIEKAKKEQRNPNRRIPKEPLYIKVLQFLKIYELQTQLKIVLFIRFLNLFKLGLLLGIFIDAFKVGS